MTLIDNYMAPRRSQGVPTEWPSLAPLSALTLLTSLELGMAGDRSHISLRESDLSPLLSLPALRHLGLLGGWDLDQTPGLAKLAVLTQLRSLVLLRVRALSLQVMGALVQLTGVRALTLSSDNFTPAFFERVQQLTGLRSLSIDAISSHNNRQWYEVRDRYLDIN